MTLAPGLKPISPAPERVPARETLPAVDTRPPLPAVAAAEAFYKPPSPEMPAPAEIIAQRGYDNLGQMLHQMFIEADQRAALEMQSSESERSRHATYTSDREMWHGFLEQVMENLRQSSTVHEIRRMCDERPADVGKPEITRLYGAYERSLRSALRTLKPDLIPPQRSDLEQALAQLDWSYKDVIASHILAVNGGEDELRYDPNDFLLLLNPRARKIEYTTTQEAQRLVQHFGSRLSKETIERDMKRRIPTHLEGVFK